MRVAILSLSLYSLPLGPLKAILRRTASYMLTWPSRLLSHVGEFESARASDEVSDEPLRRRRESERTAHPQSRP